MGARRDAEEGESGILRGGEIVNGITDEGGLARGRVEGAQGEVGEFLLRFQPRSVARTEDSVEQRSQLKVCTHFACGRTAFIGQGGATHAASAQGGEQFD